MRRGALPTLCFYWALFKRGRHKVSQEAPEISSADKGLRGQGRQPFYLALTNRALQVKPRSRAEPIRSMIPVMPVSFLHPSSPVDLSAHLRCVLAVHALLRDRIPRHMLLFEG